MKLYTCKKYVTLPRWSVVKNLPVNARGADSIPRSGESLEKETTFQFSILAWEIPWIEQIGVGATVHGVTKVSDTT